MKTTPRLHLDAELGAQRDIALRAGDNTSGAVSDNLERWFLGLEQRKAFKEQILPVPFT